MTEFKHSLVSDLHLDANKGNNDVIYDTPWEKNVIVAGDTANGVSGAVFLRKLRNTGRFVFAVDGNHEHAQNSRLCRTAKETEKAFFEMSGQESHVYNLRDDLQIAGFNGWYKIDDEQDWHLWFDGRNSHNTAEEIDALAREHAEALHSAISGFEGRTIVVTHTSPSEASLDPKFDGDKNNCYFWSPYLEQVLKEDGKKIAVWYHGHTHVDLENVIEGVPVITNPRGYPGEKLWIPKTFSL